MRGRRTHSIDSSSSPSRWDCCDRHRLTVVVAAADADAAVGGGGGGGGVGAAAAVVWHLRC